MAWARHEACQRLEKKRKHNSGQHIGLPQSQRRQANEIPKLAKSEPNRCHQENRYVGAAPVRQEGKEELGHDEPRDDPHDHARRDQSEQLNRVMIWGLRELAPTNSQPSA